MAESQRVWAKAAPHWVGQRQGRERAFPSLLGSHLALLKTAAFAVVHMQENQSPNPNQRPSQGIKVRQFEQMQNKLKVSIFLI